MATMNVSLPDQMKAWVEDQSRDGRYANASDYVRDLIRRDQERRQAYEEIGALVEEGLNSGPPVKIGVEEFLARMKEKYGE